jgi:hypothetical protein
MALHQCHDSRALETSDDCDGTTKAKAWKSMGHFLLSASQSSDSDGE